MEEPCRIAFRGGKLQVEWASTLTGAAPAYAFFMGLSAQEKASVLALFKRLADFGVIHNTELFKRLSADLWEFKKFQIRLLGDFRPKGRFVVATGLKKKQWKHRKADLEKARRVLEENDRRERA